MAALLPPLTTYIAALHLNRNSNKQSLVVLVCGRYDGGSSSSSSSLAYSSYGSGGSGDGGSISSGISRAHFKMKRPPPSAVVVAVRSFRVSMPHHVSQSDSTLPPYYNRVRLSRYSVNHGW